MLRRPQHTSRSRRIPHYQDTRHEPHHTHKQQRLGHMHAGHPYLAPRQLYRSNHRRTRPHHEAHTRKQHQQRDADVNRGNTITPYPMPDEYTVHRRHRRHAQHTAQSRDKILSEQRKHARRTQVHNLSLHHHQKFKQTYNLYYTIPSYHYTHHSNRQKIPDKVIGFTQSSCPALYSALR